MRLLPADTATAPYTLPFPAMAPTSAVVPPGGPLYRPTDPLNPSPPPQVVLGGVSQSHTRVEVVTVAVPVAVAAVVAVCLAVGVGVYLKKRQHKQHAYRWGGRKAEALGSKSSGYDEDVTMKEGKDDHAYPTMLEVGYFLCVFSNKKHAHPTMLEVG